MPSRGILPGDQSPFRLTIGWGKADMAASLFEGWNVLSITDGGAGIITFTWDRDFAAATYFVTAIAQAEQGTGTAAGVAVSSNTPPTVGAATFRVVEAAGNLVDPNNVFAFAIGKGY